MRVISRSAALCTALLMVWALAAPWAAAFPNRPDHYKVTLFGVRHVADMTAHATQSSCHWGSDDSPCRASTTGQANFRAILTVRWLALIALAAVAHGAWSAARPRARAGGATPWLAIAIAMGGAVLIFRLNVTRALAIFADARPVIAGTGMVAAIAAASAALLVAVLSVVPKSIENTT